MTVGLLASLGIWFIGFICGVMALTVRHGQREREQAMRVRAADPVEPIEIDRALRELELVCLPNAPLALVLPAFTKTLKAYVRYERSRLTSLGPSSTRGDRRA